MTACAKQISNCFLKKKSKIVKIKILTANGITSLNVCEIFGGTASGILIVIFLLTKNLYRFAVKNATKNAVNNPFDPIYPDANPSLIESTATTMNPIIEHIIVEIALIWLSTGISRFSDFVKL